MAKTCDRCGGRFTPRKKTTDHCDTCISFPMTVPELLKALRITAQALEAECCGLCEHPGEYRDDDARAWPVDGQAFSAWQQARAAIAKATGEEPTS